MQIPLLHQQILLQTERLRDLHRSIMTHSSPVPADEMEILIREIRNLYSLALQLNNENALQLLDEVQLAVNQSIPSFSKSSLQSSPDPLPPVVAHQENLQIKKSEDRPAETIQQPANKSEENTIEKKRIVSDIHEMFNDAPTFADRFSDHQTVGEKIAGNDNLKRVSDKLKTPVKDLKSAIGLNEKFQFINQLFNGDAKKYNSFIDELNASTSAESAMKSIQEISDSNNWEAHAASAKSFMDLVERRFSV